MSDKKEDIIKKLIIQHNKKAESDNMKIVKNLTYLREYLSQAAEEANVNCDELIPSNGREVFHDNELEELNGCRCIGCGGTYSNNDVMINSYGSVCMRCLYTISELLLGVQRFYVK